MTDTHTVEFSAEELAQVHRALGQRRREFVASVDAATREAVTSAWRKVARAVQEAEKALQGPQETSQDALAEEAEEKPKPRRGRPRKQPAEDS